MAKSSQTGLAVLISVFAFLAQLASADCLNRNTEVICSGDDENGLRGSAADISVRVHNGATVRNDGDAIKITAPGLHVNNLGIIVSEEKDAIQGQSGLSVYNNGTIIAGDEGITADDPPLNPYTNAFIFNTGIVSANDDAIKIGARGTIVNFGTIENTGADLNDAQDAIDIDSGVIINERSGIIRSSLAAAIDFDPSEEHAYVSNSGTILGMIGILTDPENSGSQQIVNMGSITGASGTALELGRGDDVVSLLHRGRFSGAVLLSQGNDIFSVGSGSFGDMSDDFIIDGGEGPGDEDSLDFVAFRALTALEVENVTPDVFDISVRSQNSDAIVRFTGIERFLFQGAVLSLSELREFNP